MMDAAVVISDRCEAREALGAGLCGRMCRPDRMVVCERMESMAFLTVDYL